MGKSRGQGKLERQTLVDQVYVYLRDRIVNLYLKPGDRIDVKQLSVRLGVSQTPVREAIHRLVEQGLIVSVPYVGYFVIQLSSQDVKELFDLRSAIEVLALRYAFNNLDSEQLEAYLNRLEEMKLLSGEALAKETRRFDRDFHVTLILGKADAKWLSKYVNGLVDLITLSTRLSLNPKAALNEHRKILQALLQRDLKKASEALIEHLERAKQDAVLFLRRVAIRDKEVHENAVM